MVYINWSNKIFPVYWYRYWAKNIFPWFRFLAVHWCPKDWNGMDSKKRKKPLSQSHIELSRVLTAADHSPDMNSLVVFLVNLLVVAPSGVLGYGSGSPKCGITDPGHPGQSREWVICDLWLIVDHVKAWAIFADLQQTLPYSIETRLTTLLLNRYQI